MSECPELVFIIVYALIYARLLSRTMVDIYVGPESTHWNLHEKLLCYHSPFFAKTFYDKKYKSASSKSFGMPDVDDAAFELFVGWLYSRALRYPQEEKDIGPLLELYLLADKFDISKLAEDVVETVRAFYHNNETYPGLRRVQYIYAETGDDDIMREMMVASVARYLTLSDSIPPHWDRALRKNGQLAVDIIRSIQEWHLDTRSVPDARDASMDRGRKFSGHHQEEGSSLGEVKEKGEEDGKEGGSEQKANGE